METKKQSRNTKPTDTPKSPEPEKREMESQSGRESEITSTQDARNYIQSIYKSYYEVYHNHRKIICGDAPALDVNLSLRTLLQKWIDNDSVIVPFEHITI